MEKQLLELVFSNDHNLIILSHVFNEFFDTDKNLKIDIDAVAERNEWVAYQLIDALQGSHHIDLDTGYVICKSYFEFYHTLMDMYIVLEKHTEYEKVQSFVYRIESHLPLSALLRNIKL